MALAELELQKPIQANWKDADISERPILVLDRDGGDFYRYYEYRVVRDKKFLGAIRIPAYRRTENFATAQVHLYSADEQTYTIHPTMWGKNMTQNIKFDGDFAFAKKVEQLIKDKSDDNYYFNYMVHNIQNEGVLNHLPSYDRKKAFDELHKYLLTKHTIDELKAEIRKLKGRGLVVGDLYRALTNHINRNLLNNYIHSKTETAKLETKYTVTLNNIESSKELLLRSGIVGSMSTFMLYIKLLPTSKSGIRLNIGNK